VSFNDGILRWTEEDRFLPEEHRILFRQLSGDLEHFEGEWKVEEEGDGCSIRFSASFDLGVPTLSDMLDPIAEQALRDNVELILSGLRTGLASPEGGNQLMALGSGE
jgi:ribosome-associated toxin RatA of RatAB toxin-antitoxin module